MEEAKANQETESKGTKSKKSAVPASSAVSQDDAPLEKDGAPVSQDDAPAEKEGVPAAGESAFAQTETPTPKEGEAVNEETPPDARTAFAAFYAALSEEERGRVCAVITALSKKEAEEKRRGEEESALEEMEKLPRFADIRENERELREMMGKIPWLRTLPPREGLCAAYFINKGLKSHAPTKEELLSALLSDVSLQKELALRRHRLQSAIRDTLPPRFSRMGQARVPASVKRPPKTIGEATEEAKKQLRISEKG